MTMNWFRSGQSARGGVLRLLGMLLILAGAVGCGVGPRRAADVDTERAHEALERTMSAWKAGTQLPDLRSQWGITCQDLDWERGQVLVEYSVLGPGQAQNANLLIPVELTLRDAAGKQTSKRATYVVSTDPSITVFREMF